MDETYIKVKGQWYYLYRAVDKHGQTIDFLLTEHRDKEAALRFLKKAIRRNGLPETITIDGSDANEAAIKSYNREQGTAIVIRQVKYLNNIVEQDHRAVKRVTRRMLGFKSFDAAQGTLVGIELMHMIKKRQMLTFPYRYFSKYRVLISGWYHVKVLCSHCYGYISLGSFVRHSHWKGLPLRCHGLSSACGSRKPFERIWHGPNPLIFMYFHVVLFGKQHEI